MAALERILGKYVLIKGDKETSSVLFPVMLMNLQDLLEKFVILPPVKLVSI
jgi:hypothetical protein